jgi:hypothetical protein
MSTPTDTDGPQKSFTAQEIDAWLLATAERHAAIHLKAAHPWNEHHLHEAFADMSVLFLEAFEEVRVVSEQLHEESQATRSKSRACGTTMPNSSNKARPRWNTWRSFYRPLLKRYTRPKAGCWTCSGGSDIKVRGPSETLQARGRLGQERVPSMSYGGVEVSP